MTPDRRVLLARRALLATLCVGAVGGLGAGVHDALARKGPRRVRIATGPRGGRHLPVGEALAASLGEALPDTRFEAMESPGSTGNLALLDARRAELAVVSSDVPERASARVIAPLYREVFQLVVRAEVPATVPGDLRGLRVSVGPHGSASEAVSRVVFARHGLDGGAATVVNMAHADAAEALARGELDAMCVLGGLRTPAVDAALARGARLLGLGEVDRAGSALDALVLEAPWLEPTVIPQATYGIAPPTPIGTVSLQALLVARSDLSDVFVRAVTAALFQHKTALTRRERCLASLSERFDIDALPLPLHAGARAWYRREDPPAILTWASTLSLALSVLALAASGLASLRAARSAAARERIQTWHDEARAIVTSTDDDALRRERLWSLHRRAFQALADDTVEADGRFLAFQRYLRVELAALRERLPREAR